MIELNLNQPDGPSGIGERIANIYHRITGSDNEHRRNDSSLRLIQFGVITLSACATGGVNAFAHRQRLTWVGAILLAAFIMVFVEKFYFTLRHGLMKVYRSRKQRFAAKLCYRTIQMTMILNAMILCAWVTGLAMPEFLSLWNRWSIAIHFALALLGVSAVRDSDVEAENHIREMQAGAAEHDLRIIRRAAAINHSFLPRAARLRGWLDGFGLSLQVLRDHKNKPQIFADSPREMADAPQRPYLLVESAGEHFEGEHFLGEQKASAIGVGEHFAGEQFGAAPALKGKQNEGEQVGHQGGEQLMGEQPLDSLKVNTSTTPPTHRSAQPNGTGVAHDHDKDRVVQLHSADDDSSSEPSTQKGEHSEGEHSEGEGEHLESEHSEGEGEHSKGKHSAGEHFAGKHPVGEQVPSEPYSQWLKSILPETVIGWWDVRVNGERFTVKYRWRDPDLQVITLLHLPKERLEALKQNNQEDGQNTIREQLTTNLQGFLNDPARREKALIAAEKLGINLNGHRVVSIGN